jgi:D-alanine-D-alanine ligase
MPQLRGTEVSPKVAIIYNQPEQDRYSAMGEQKAVLGVLIEVKAVHTGLTKLGYAVEQVAISPPLEAVQQTLSHLAVDAVFNLFEGFAGRPETEAAVAAMLAEFGVPYTGCSAAALSLTLDKSRTKDILQLHGLPTPAFQVLDPTTIDRFDLRFPCIVKPAAEDASHGLSERSVVTDIYALKTQVLHISELYNGQALVEEYVDGREFNVSVMGNDQPTVLPISEIVYTLPAGMPRILTFEAKWEPHSLYFKSSAPVCPASIDGVTRQRIAESALGAYKLLGCTGYARVDFRMGPDSIPQIIEVNANPDLSPGYGVALQSRLAGMSYVRLVERIMQLAMERRAIGA